MVSGHDFTDFSGPGGCVRRQRRFRGQGMEVLLEAARGSHAVCLWICHGFS